MKYINEQSSKIEDRISPDKFNREPLKVVITQEIGEDSDYYKGMDINEGIDTVRKIVNQKLGTRAIDWKIKRLK